MEVVYPTCSGVDVHKKFLIATIIKTTNSLEPSYLYTLSFQNRYS